MSLVVSFPYLRSFSFGSNTVDVYYVLITSSFKFFVILSSGLVICPQSSTSRKIWFDTSNKISIIPRYLSDTRPFTALVQTQNSFRETGDSSTVGPFHSDVSTQTFGVWSTVHSSWNRSPVGTKTSVFTPRSQSRERHLTTEERNDDRPPSLNPINTKLIMVTCNFIRWYSVHQFR